MEVSSIRERVHTVPELGGCRPAADISAGPRTTPRLRVLLILPDLAGGGGERTTLNLQRHLDPGRYEVDIALLEPRGEYFPSISELRCVLPQGRILRALARSCAPDSAGRALPQIFLLRSLIAAQKPDVVMSSMADVSIPLAIAWKLLPRRRRRTRWIAREGNNTPAVLKEAFPRNTWRRVVERAIAYSYRAADVVVTPCKGVADDLVQQFGVRRKAIRVIGNPVDLAVVGAAAMQAPAIALPRKFVVGVGRLAHQKGFDLLLRAFAALNRPDLDLVVLGTGPEGEALRGLAESLGLADRFHLPGFLANPWPVVARAEVFCLSSRWEGFGHVIVEAMACGTPIVVSGCAHGPEEIVRDGVDGLVVAPNDWQSLRDGLAAALGDPAGAAKRAAAARKRAGDFDASRIAGAYSVLFEEKQGRGERANRVN